MGTTAITRKNLARPDNVTRFEKGEQATVNVDGATVARAVFQPGWRWSEHVGPATGQRWCNTPHLGYVISGRLMVEMRDGAQIEMGPGDTALIWPGHDGWTVGDEPCVFLEFPPPVV